MASMQLPQPFLPTYGKPIIQWKNWFKFFNNYLLASGCDGYSAERKKAILLTCLGTEGQRIFYTLDEATATYDENDDAYIKATKLLQSHFQPKENCIAARVRFRRRAQKPGECIETFVTDLRELVVPCEYKDDSVNEMLRDQIVEKNCVPNLQQRLMLETNLTLETALIIAKQTEQALKECKSISRDNDDDAISFVKDETNQTLRKGYSGRKKQCYRCGSMTHLANDRNCQAREATCNNCGKVGHYSRMCLKTTRNLTNSGKNIINTILPTVQKFKPVVCTVTINSVPLPFIVDSGSPITIISKETYSSYFPKRKLEINSQEFYSYSKQKIQMLGYFIANVSLENRKIQSPIYVSGEGSSILGRDLLQGLNLTLFGNTLQVSSVSESTSTTKSNECEFKLPPELQDYASLFQPSLGLVKGYVHDIKLKHDATPFQAKLRRLPLSIRDKVTEELKRLENEDVIEKVNASEWVSPLVVAWKKTGKLRLCVDLRKLNQSIVVDKYPLPHIDELLNELHGAKYFAKLDLASAYHQLLLEENSRNLTTFITHEGLFRFKRVCFGLASAPATFQKLMNLILQGLPGVKCYLDDIIVYGKTKAEYDKSLRDVLTRINDMGLKLNDKCKFGLSSVQFLGHVITDEGLKPAPDQTKAINDAPPPTDVKTLRSFLGLVGYYAKFCPAFATIVEPLRAILRGNSTFEWTAEANKSFNRIKKLISEHITLALYNPALQTVVTTDASAYGISAVLSQISDENERIVACVSRTLTATERNYSVGEKEALACVWACERWHNFLWGRPFILRTDHKTLTTLLHYTGSARPTMRIARWNARLLNYNYTIEYKPGSENFFADALSRLPLSGSSESDFDDEVICFINLLHDEPNNITLKQLQMQTDGDETLQKVVRHHKQRWKTYKKKLEPACASYFLQRDELTLHDKVLYRGERIVLPKALAVQVIQLAHIGHQGIVRTKQRIRERYWWPGMDKEITDAVQKCTVCQANDKTAITHTAPLQPVPQPKGPWEKVAIDIVGPCETLPTNCRYAITLIDYFSKWPEVMFVPQARTADVIQFLINVFSREGYPAEIVTDHGPQFTSLQFKDYLQNRNISHLYSAIYHPESNGAVERFNRVLKESLQSLRLQGKHIVDGTKEFLCMYRCTPHCTTEVSPSELLHGRRMRTGVDIKNTKELKKHSKRLVIETVKNKQNKAKLYTDAKRSAQFSNFNVGDCVRVRKPTLVKKGESSFTAPVHIAGRVGPATYETEDGKRWNQNRLASCNGKSDGDHAIASSSTDLCPESNPIMSSETTDSIEAEPQMLRRSARERRPPAWHKDFIVHHE